MPPPELGLHAKVNFSLHGQNFEVVVHTSRSHFTTQPETTADISPENFIILQDDKSDNAKTHNVVY